MVRCSRMFEEYFCRIDLQALSDFCGNLSGQSWQSCRLGSARRLGYGVVVVRVDIVLSSSLSTRTRTSGSYVRV